MRGRRLNNEGKQQMSTPSPPPPHRTLRFRSTIKTYFSLTQRKAKVDQLARGAASPRVVRKKEYIGRLKVIVTNAVLVEMVDACDSSGHDAVNQQGRKEVHRRKRERQVSPQFSLLLETRGGINNNTDVKT